MTRQLSYTCGLMSKPFIHCTIPDIILERSNKMPNTEAFVHYKADNSRESITYKILQGQSERLAKYLLTVGIKKQDKIALIGPNSINRLIGEFGIIMSGGVVLHISPSMKDISDIRENLSTTNCTCLLVDQGEDDSLHPLIDQVIEQIVLSKLTKCTRLIFLRNSKRYARYSTLDWKSFSDNYYSLLPTLYPEETIVIFSSSGSTGKPKLIEHSHISLMNLGPRHVIAKNRYVDRLYNDRPFCWSAGSPLACLPVSYTRIFADADLSLKRKYATAIWEIISKERCDFAIFMPYMATDLISQREKIRSTFQLKGLLLTGQHITKNLIQSSEWMAENIIVTYGSTESMIISATEFMKRGDTRQTGYVGYPLPGTEIKITDENGTTLEYGQNGEVWTRSSCRSKIYVDEAANEANIKIGWFKTGDVGVMSKDGQLTIIGRLGFRISRGTRKIYPESIECQISKMAEIDMVIVVPVSDERLLQEICVCFVSKKEYDIQPEKVEKYCSDTFADTFAMDGMGDKPRYYIRFQSLPVLSNGKQDRHKIKNEAKKLLLCNNWSTSVSLSLN